MYIADIKKVDVANGPGVRVSVFVSGCNHKCKGCFNEDAWNFKYGKEYTSDDEKKIIDYLNNDYITGLTILGGEPFEYVNQVGILPLIKKIKELFPNKTIWCYSGFTFEQLKNMNFKETNEILSNIDVLVDGKFVIEQKNLRIKFRGSENQRIIDVKRSNEENRVILMDEYMK